MAQIQMVKSAILAANRGSAAPPRFTGVLARWCGGAIDQWRGSPTLQQKVGTGLSLAVALSNLKAMCNRYVSPTAAGIERHWQLQPGQAWRGGSVFPFSPGPFIRKAPEQSGVQRELVIGQWGLIPWFAQSPRLRYATNNARSEELSAKASFKHPWQRGQRCIIPALAFDEPNWETGRNVWWTFARADHTPWGLAGLWNTWIDKVSGEMVESYTMCTMNADNHPLMSRMHKPDPSLAADQQDKRSVVVIEAADVEQWLTGSEADARALIRLAPGDLFDAHPSEEPPRRAAVKGREFDF